MNASTRQLVRRRAGDACEYCCIPQEATPFISFHIEHITARQHGGTDDLGDLALACDRCNAYKGTNLTSIDPQTGNLTLLFNPRHDQWNDHFSAARRRYCRSHADWPGHCSVAQNEQPATRRTPGRMVERNGRLNAKCIRVHFFNTATTAPSSTAALLPCLMMKPSTTLCRPAASVDCLWGSSISLPSLIFVTRMWCVTIHGPVRRDGS
jgi:hypothetical protein